MGISTFFLKRTIKYSVRKWINRVLGISEYYTETDSDSDPVEILKEVLESFMGTLSCDTFKINESTGDVFYVFAKFIVKAVESEFLDNQYFDSINGTGLIIKYYNEEMMNYQNNPLKGASARRRIAESMIRAGTAAMTNKS